ncbi:MAG: YraN family protein [Alphaproteobacteria bacterium]|nr:YraN family protein [Alphaproteobacteria bacterium]
MNRRVAAERAGRRAEAVAVWLLRLKGYAILARRFRTPVGELNIVARRAGTLAFVEVKQRARREAALAALTARQRWRLRRAALAFQAAHPSAAGLHQRFDLVLVIPWRRVIHIIDAWRP